MSQDLTSLENDLRKLRPALLDQAMIERLEGCAAGNWDRTRPLELQGEHRLRNNTPAPLDEMMIARILSQASSVPFPKPEPKILPFPASATAQATSRPACQPSRWLASAAAVAVMGALAAMMVPQPVGNGSNLAANNAPRTSESRPAAQASARPSSLPLVPAGLNRGLREARDEGVVLNNKRLPHRILKFVYNEQVTYKDAEGRTYQVEQPRVEYLIVPAKTD
jgi:hypothetical protein